MTPAMREIPAGIAPFWAEFEAAMAQSMSHRFYEATHFDDNEPSADHLADLVVARRKRATAGLAWSYEGPGKAAPRPGDLSVVTTFRGVPVCVIETESVLVVPFDEVDAEFAAAEGEGDGSLAYWKRVHWDYFTRECARIGREPARTMPVVCERFSVVYAPLHDSES